MKASSPWKTLKELVDYAGRPIPKKFESGIRVLRQVVHIPAVALFNAAGAKDHVVPFSAGQATVNLLGDRIEAAVQFPQAFVSHVKNGDLRVLGMLGTIADPSFPEATAKASGTRWVSTCSAASRVPKGRREGQ